MMSHEQDLLESMQSTGDFPSKLQQNAEEIMCCSEDTWNENVNRTMQFSLTESFNV